MKVKAGDYIRTEYGIAEVISTKAKDEDGNNVLQVNKMLEPYYWDGCDSFLCDPKDVIDSITPSIDKSILDLVKPGDYINGVEVIDLADGVHLEFAHNVSYVDVGLSTYRDGHVEGIESIVTKEQFEKAKYYVRRNTNGYK